MFTLTYNQKGFAAFFVTILVLAIMLGLAFSITILVLGEQQISKNIVKSTQAYYIAEAGIEDALLRLKENPTTLSISYNMNVGQGVGSVDISDTIGGSRIIISQGNIFERARKVQVIYAVDTSSVSFYYGAQAGAGGVEMENNSVIYGNVFSNGSIIGAGTITETAIIAGNGNKIEGLTIEGDAYVHTCKDSVIFGTLTYVSGGSIQNCTTGETVDGGPNEIEPEGMPISDSQIDSWKNEAAGGGVEPGDYTIGGGVTEYLGPRKIDGNLIIENNATLVLTGILWVTGNITINNGTAIVLDASYGSTSGLIVADGKILAENGVILDGSGAEGSYLMLLTTNDSILLADPAIYVKNNAQGAIFYASNGMIRLRNNINIREATAYKLYLDNNAEITYESGLINSLFSSGPGGSWQIKTWSEVE